MRATDARHPQMCPTGEPTGFCRRWPDPYGPGRLVSGHRFANAEKDGSMSVEFPSTNTERRREAKKEEKAIAAVATPSGKVWVVSPKGHSRKRTTTKEERRFIMSRSRIRAWILGLFAAVALLGSVQGVRAQAMSQPQGNGQGAGQYKGPGIPGKMNSTKNSERWAAAIRAHDIRAANIRANAGKAKGH